MSLRDAIEHVEALAVDLGIDPDDPEPGRFSRARCPACLERTGKDDHRGALSIDHGQGWARCFKCGWRHLLSGWPDDRDDGPRLSVEPAPARRGVDLPDGYKALFAGSIRTRAAEAWVLDRGVSREVAVAAEVGVGLGGPDAGRLIVPVRAADGTLLGWIRRPYRRKGPNVSSRGLGRPFYRADLLESPGPPIAVVEGVWDAMALWDRAIAALGKPNRPQVEAIASACRRTGRAVVVLLDGDAWEDGWAVAERLRLLGARAVAERLPPGTDPDDFSNLVEIVDHAIARKYGTEAPRVGAGRQERNDASSI